jgi:hypothetical protein
MNRHDAKDAEVSATTDFSAQKIFNRETHKQFGILRHKKRPPVPAFSICRGFGAFHG